MSRNKAIVLYCVSTLGQIALVCLAVFLLRRSGLIVDYSTPVGMIAIAIGGISSALWGTVFSVKYRKIKPSKVLRDFFNLKQDSMYYMFVLLFLLLDFFYLIWGGYFRIPVWYLPFVLFLKAIVFGGIEEIGWRYFFQPTMQERYNYVVATLCTFISWGIWHFAYFYVEGTISSVDPTAFLLGLLVNCFILSAIYNATQSLWLCVMEHALINVFSQLAVGGNTYVAYVCKALIIVIAIMMQKKIHKKNNRKG